MTRLPEEIVAFLHGTVIVYAGSRDEHLGPDLTFVLGVTAGEDRETLTFYVLAPQAAELLRNAENNGLVSLVVTEPLSHRTYQFKGSFAGARPSEARDHAVQDLWWDKLTTYLPATGYQLPAVTWVRRPTLAISLRVEEIFDQTPGPGSGRRLGG